MHAMDIMYIIYTLYVIINMLFISLHNNMVMHVYNHSNLCKSGVHKLCKLKRICALIIHTLCALIIKFV